MKNDYEIRGDVTAIFTRSKGEKLEILIDTSDLDLVKTVRTYWSVHVGKYNYRHVVTQGTYDGKKKIVTIHKLIMNTTSGMVVDHINGDTLDNRKENLRIVTQGENSQNRKGPQSNNKSGYHGVDKKGGHWRGQYRHKGKNYHVGTFNNPEEAYAAVMQARMCNMPYSREASQLYTGR